MIWWPSLLWAASRIARSPPLDWATGSNRLL
jgi:hypothetical protein